MIPIMKLWRGALRRSLFPVAGLFLLLFAGCFFFVHGTLPPPPRAAFHADSDCCELQFAPDSNTLVSVGMSSDGVPVQVWDVATGRLRYTVILSSLGVDTVRLSPDSQLLALDSLDDGLLMVFDLHTGRELAHWQTNWKTGRELATHSRPAPYYGCIRGFVFDGRYVAIEDVIREKGIIRLWDPRTQTEIGQIEGYFTGDKLPSHGRNLAIYAWAEFGKVKIRLWQLPDSGPPVVIKEMLVPGRYAAFTPDLTRFATCIANDVTQIAVWDTATGQRLCSVPDERVKPLPDIYFEGNGRLLVAVDEHVPMGSPMSGSLRRIWNLASVPTPTAVLSTKEWIDFSPDGKWLALPGYDDATLIDVDTREMRDLFSNRDYVRRPYGMRLAFSPDSQVLAVAGLHQQARAPLPAWLPARLHRLFDSPDPVTHLWDTSTGREHSAILPGRRALFSPDGQTLLTLDEDNTIRLWDFPLHRPLGRDLGLSALLWLTLMLLVGVGRVVVRMIFRLAR
jgi:WD40 repeat protein